MSEDATIPVARDHGVGTNGGAAGPLMDSLGSLAMAMPERVGHAAVHIGLGKTATTFLQTNVFPLLEKHGVIDSYNAPRLLAMAGKHHLVGLSDQELATFAATFQQSGRVFLSNESLSPWNPAEWKAARDRNLQLFGPDTTIIITIREPLSYLTSVYIQYLQEGNIKEPAEFFVADDIYDDLRSVLPRFREPVFAVQQFDLSALIRMYQDVYRSVVVVRMEEIFSLEFLRRIFQIDEPVMAALRAASREGSAQNVSYSAAAVRMTFARERILRALGMKSIGTTDFELRKLLAYVRASDGPHGTGSDAPGVDRRPGPADFLIDRLKWTYLMQRIVDRIVPYKRYALPAGVVPHDVLLKNVEFYEGLARAAEGLCRT